MQQGIIELSRLGPMPPSAKVIREHLDELVISTRRPSRRLRSQLRTRKRKPWLRVFGPDDFFGAAWTLVNLIESAPGWPLRDCLENTDNEWIRTLKRSARNSGLL